VARSCAMSSATATRTMTQARADPDPPKATEPLEVVVPYQRTPLAPVAAARVRELRRNLVVAMRDERTVKAPHGGAKPPPAEPCGFVARVLQAGCALCQGHCCKGGGTHAYIDDRTMARVRRDRPEADAWAILRLYTAAVPRLAYAGSCVFHGEMGCSLPRPLRADLCNRYYCDGLQHFLQTHETARPVRITASRDGLTGGTAVVRPDAGA
jgi:hypothetical protein